MTPVLYDWPRIYKRLANAPQKPGHLVLRRWLQKGRDQGFASVPFASAVRAAMADPDINVCLVGRREASEKTAKAWQKVIDTVPAFDISGEVDAPVDLDPLEPPWETPLDAPLPSDEQLRSMIWDPRVEETMREKFPVSAEELSLRASGGRAAEEALVFRRVVEGLPEELRGEEFRNLIRSSILEIVKLLLNVHFASGAARMRWRFVCTDVDSDLPTWPESMRAYFVLAGEDLTFVPRQFVDDKGLQAVKQLTEEQTRRMSSEKWASSVTLEGTDAAEALKRVPAGWTTFLKGDQYPGMRGKGAVFRLPRTGRRVKIEVEVLEWGAPGDGASAQGGDTAGRADDGGASGESAEQGGAKQWGALAGLTAGLIAFAQNTPPFQFGKKRRNQVKDVLRALQKRPEKNLDAEVFARFEQRLWMDFNTADEAPVVLVVGGESTTGRTISRKLVSSGYHVVLLKGGAQQQRVERLLPQGTVLASTTAKLSTKLAAPWVTLDTKSYGGYGPYLPTDLYGAVAGIDKLVICSCDTDGPGTRKTMKQVTDVLSAWQLYRADFAEAQKAYSAKVQIFDFDREVDFELWSVDRNHPSDAVYGILRAVWTRNRYGTAHFIGRFYEPVAQTLLKSPVLKLNFKRFCGILFRVYNQAENNKYSFFLRTGDFEDSRVQYEADFVCKASTWHTIRLPFGAFRPVRVDGVEIPENEAAARPLDREKVVQIGIVVRTGPNPKINDAQKSEMGYFSLALKNVRAFRTQAEPQVVYVGQAEESGAGVVEDPGEEEEEDDFFDDIVDMDEDFLRRSQAEEAAAAELEELEGALVPAPDPEPDEDEDDEPEDYRSAMSKTPMDAIVASGLAYTIIKVNGVNDHPGGKYPIGVMQDSPREMPLSGTHDDLRKISRGDVAELVVSTLMEPACVNTELAAGEVRKNDEPPQRSGAGAYFRVNSTMQDDVKAHLKKLTPNR